MTVYLNVFSRFDARKGGVLEMRSNTLNGQLIQTFEWIGAGSTDGGVWKWIMGSKAVEAHLTSNITKRTTAILQSTRWGANSPPAEPWFADSNVRNGNTLLYFMLNNSTETCDWFLKT